MSVSRAATLLALVGAAVAVVVAVEACQIFGLERVRCDPAHDIGACDVGEFCAPDGFCAPKNLDTCAPIPDSVDRTLTVGVSRNSLKVAGRVVVSQDGRTVSFDPADTLATNASYAIDVTSGLHDRSGNPAVLR